MDKKTIGSLVEGLGIPNNQFDELREDLIQRVLSYLVKNKQIDPMEITKHLKLMKNQFNLDQFWESITTAKITKI